MNKVSIIIPTYNRSNSLIRLLKSLECQKRYIREIIIIEQVFNNNDLYLKAVNKLSSLIKYIYIKSKSTSRAKNLGIQISKSKIIVFFDDDVTVEPNNLYHHLNNFKDINIAAVCGRCITIGQNIEENNKRVGKISQFAQFSDGYSSTIKQKIDTVIGCNASWRRDILTKLNGFDENFTGNAIREESDLSLRAKKLGYFIIFEPFAIIKHFRENSGGSRKSDDRLSWYFDFFSNELYFYLKHFNFVYLPIFFLTRIEWILRCMFGIGREVSLRTVMLPIHGYINGLIKYQKYIHENRN